MSQPTAWLVKGAAGFSDLSEAPLEARAVEAWREATASIAFRSDPGRFPARHPIRQPVRHDPGADTADQGHQLEDQVDAWIAAGGGAPVD